MMINRRNSEKTCTDVAMADLHINHGCVYNDFRLSELSGKKGKKGFVRISTRTQINVLIS